MPKFNSIRASSMREYIGIVKEALYEIDDLRASVEYDEEYMDGALSFINDLDAGVRTLLQSLEDGSYEFGKGELPFIEIVRNVSDNLLPFKHLFMRIELTHKQGLDEELPQD
ncbi:MAG: general secretion pathway protein GspF [Gammaproteobacteria bacterium]|nr:general secretion pathway protein GspF [Gammaproteobacteria bacterium]